MEWIFLLLTFLSVSVFAQNKIQPPAWGAYHGAYMDFGATASEVNREKIREYHELAGKKAAWAYFANDWLDGKIVFPRESVNIIESEGLVPYLRLLPWSIMSAKVTKADPVFNMASLISGKHDKALKEFFLQAREHGPLMMEFGPEVNGDWFPWNGRWNGGSKRNGYGDPHYPDGPERFRDAFRRVIDISREAGAHNITWVFHIDSAKSPHKEWNDVKYYYPGDHYIDWIGISVFGAQLPDHEWIIFQKKLKNFVPEIERMQSTRPWLIAEFASIERRNDPNKKAIWIQQALRSIESGLFRKVKGITYWHAFGWLANGTASFRIDSSPQSLLSFRTEIQKPFWLNSLEF